MTGDVSSLFDKELEKEEIKREFEEAEKEEKPEIRVETKQVKAEEKQPIGEVKAVEEEKPVKNEEVWEREEKSIEELWREEKPKVKVEQEEVRKQIKELFEGPRGTIKLVRFREKIGAIKEPIKNIFEITRKFDRQKLTRYAVPVVMLLLIVSVLFVSKSGLTGHVTLTREETYDDNLNLIINESGNYTWTTDKTGDIESIKASGKVKGNGDVRIYIEKDGERYLIYDNKAAD